MYMRFLHQEAGLSTKEIKSRFPQHKTRSIDRHAKIQKPMDRFDKRKNNKGRPRKLTVSN